MQLNLKHILPPTEDGHNYASQLVNQISHLNNGKYLEDLGNIIKN